MATAGFFSSSKRVQSFVPNLVGVIMNYMNLLLKKLKDYVHVDSSLLQFLMVLINE